MRRKVLGRPGRRLELNINVDLKEMGWEVVVRLVWARIGNSG